MEKIREVIPENVKDYVAIGVLTAGGCMVALKVTSSLLNCISEWQKLRRWNNTKKDVVILHRCVPAVACPNASPFVLKLETYLRMAQIPYEVDFKDETSPKGKTPWITLNGEHISDSQLCIEYLAKKFDKKIGNHSDRDLGISTLARISLDEYFYWGLILWRYVYSWEHDLGPNKVIPAFFTPLRTPIFGRIFKQKVLESSSAQGLGRHSKEEVFRLASENLRAVSNVLGNKKFILGDEPCEDDCAIFGELAQAVWCSPGSPYEKLVNGELQNLKEYCLRMKETYWPDWNEQISQSK